MGNDRKNENGKDRKALYAIMLGTVILFFIFTFMKSGLFIDEIYTFGLSNSHESGFIKAKMGGDVREKTITREMFEDYLSVQPDEKFDLVSVYHNQEKDVHPPLYYWMFNILYSFFPGSYSIWPALMMDLALHLVTIYLLHRLLGRLFPERTALLCTALYAFSSISISTALMIRMYVLLTTLTVSLANLILDILENPRWYDYILLTLDIYLGMMTQYYFVFYAFLVCLAVLICTIIAREYRKSITFSISAILGVILMVLSFPAVIRHLTGDGLVSGTTAISNAFNLKGYLGSLFSFGGGTFRQLPVAALTGVICLAMSFSTHFDQKKGEEMTIQRKRALIIFIPAIISFVIVAIVSPYKTSRYIWNIAPIFIVCLAFVMDTSRILERHSRLIPLLLLLTVMFDFVLQPEYLMKETDGIEESLSDHTDLPCVLLQPNSNPQITANMLQLMEFDDVFVTDDTRSQNLQQYLENAEECILCINIWKEDHPMDVDMSLKSLENLYGFKEAEFLTTSPFYEIYHLHR